MRSSRLLCVRGYHLHLQCLAPVFLQTNVFARAFVRLQICRIEIGSLFNALESEDGVAAGSYAGQAEVSMLVGHRFLVQVEPAAEIAGGNRDHDRVCCRMAFTVNYSAVQFGGTSPDQQVDRISSSATER